MLEEGKTRTVGLGFRLHQVESRHRSPGAGPEGRPVPEPPLPRSAPPPSARVRRPEPTSARSPAPGPPLRGHRGTPASPRRPRARLRPRRPPPPPAVGPGSTERRDVPTTVEERSSSPTGEPVFRRSPHLDQGVGKLHDPPGDGIRRGLLKHLGLVEPGGEGQGGRSRSHPSHSPAASLRSCARAWRTAGLRVSAISTASSRVSVRLTSSAGLLCLQRRGRRGRAQGEGGAGPAGGDWGNRPGDLSAMDRTGNPRTRGVCERSMYCSCASRG
jgi:hypothetical protein